MKANILRPETTRLLPRILVLQKRLQETFATPAIPLGALCGNLMEQGLSEMERFEARCRDAKEARKVREEKAGNA